MFLVFLYIYFLVFGAADKCCKYLFVTNQYHDNLLYHWNGTLLHDRPVYIGNYQEEQYAIWFTGLWWMNGWFSNIEQDQILNGWQYSDQNAMCPNLVSIWRGTINAKWPITDASVECQADISCNRYCNRQSPSGCWCDNACSPNGDCCIDYEAMCGSERDTTTTNNNNNNNKKINNISKNSRSSDDCVIMVDSSLSESILFKENMDIEIIYCPNIIILDGELSLNSNKRLTTALFVQLTNIKRYLIINHNAALESIGFPVLQEIGIDLYIFHNNALTTIKFIELNKIGSNLYISKNDNLKNVEFPVLRNLSESTRITNNKNLYFLSFCRLDKVSGSFRIYENSHPTIVVLCGEMDWDVFKSQSPNVSISCNQSQRVICSTFLSTPPPSYYTRNASLLMEHTAQDEKDGVYNSSSSLRKSQINTTIIRKIISDDWRSYLTIIKNNIVIIIVVLSIVMLLLVYVIYKILLKRTKASKSNSQKKNSDELAPLSSGSDRVSRMNI